jgi:hypothetical protein
MEVIMVDIFDNGNNPSNRGRTARDNQATRPLSILQQEVLSLKNLVNEHSKEISALKNNNTQLGGRIEVTDNLMMRFKKALTRREELDDDWKSNFLYDIEGKLIKMGNKPKLTDRQTNKLCEIFAALGI